jgi:aryl-alcohol dehydrogenase-like predicted oxidoreductase
VTLTSELPFQGLGCMRMRADTDGDPDRDSTRVVHAAIDAGVTMIDTADMYGNEELVGRALRGRRPEAMLCSKFGVIWGEDGDWSVRADAAYVREACDASLRRLGVETIDLYYLHHRSDDIPIEETVGAMADLARAGKIRAVGLSNVTEEDVRRAHVVHPVAAVQEMWALSHRELEQMVPALVELGIAVVAHSPTAHGTLRASESRPGLADALRETAAAHGTAPGRVALAWVHGRAERWGLPVVPLPGTTSVRHLADNVAAAHLVLSDDDLGRLEQASTAA